jgi:hypothetical protein
MFHCVVTFDRSAALAIFGFGRRSTPNADKYIVPPKLWADPENAAFFARIGRKPNDPGNLRVTRDDVVRMIDEGRKTVDERIRQIKAKALAEGHDDIHLGMFWLIQENCWNGEVGEFLIYHLRLNPYDEWNTVITGDERTASILDIPIYPGGSIPHLAQTGETILLQLRDKLRAAQAEALRTHELDRFADVADIYEDTVAKVKRLAQMFSEGLVEISRDMLRKRAENRAETGL